MTRSGLEAADIIAVELWYAKMQERLRKRRPRQILNAILFTTAYFSCCVSMGLLLGMLIS